MKDDPQNGTVLRAPKNIFAPHIAKEASSAVKGHAPDRPISADLPMVFPPSRPQLDPATADAIIKRFQPLLLHCPRNIKILETLAEAYARNGMFDKALSFYQHALEIAGGKNPTIEEAIEENTLKKLDLELSQLDPKASNHAAERERLQNQRLEYQWHMMEESPPKHSIAKPV